MGFESTASPRRRIPADIDFITLKPKFGRQANRLAASGDEQLRFVIALDRK
jgi:hypothetical protein